MLVSRILENLTEAQKNGWFILQKKNTNCFLTGHAGTGKTHLLKQWLSKHSYKRGVKVMASTGMAAVAIGGRTFHSFFGLGIGKGKDEEIVDHTCKNGRKVQLIKETDCIIVDEISMLSGRLINIANIICQHIRGNPSPWGGIKVITCGDFGQLPPISDDGSPTIDWAFKSETWKSSDMKTIFLDDPVRTEDVEFLNILDKVRVGHVDLSVAKFLKNHILDPSEIDSFEGTRIYSTRAKVDEFNRRKLDELPSEEVTFQTSYTGNEQYFETLKNSLPIPDLLVLKKDALVMLRVNDMDGKFINGTLARVIICHKFQHYLELENILTHERFIVYKHTFEWQNDTGKVVAEARNFPVTLAWACTIHKSQGASISRLLVDMGYLWEYGQAYVALSRSSDPTNLKIINPNVDGIKACPEVIEFYENLETSQVEETCDIEYDRISGEIVCQICNRKYYDHPDVPRYSWLTRGCDGKNYKL